MQKKTAQVDHPKNFAATLPDYDLTKTPLKADIIKMAQARYNVTMPQVEGSRKSVLEDGTKKMAIENAKCRNLERMEGARITEAR